MYFYMFAQRYVILDIIIYLNTYSITRTIVDIYSHMYIQLDMYIYIYIYIYIYLYSSTCYQSTWYQVLDTVIPDTKYFEYLAPKFLVPWRLHILILGYCMARVSSLLRWPAGDIPIVLKPLSTVYSQNVGTVQLSTIFEQVLTNID